MLATKPHTTDARKVNETAIPEEEREDVPKNLYLRRLFHGLDWGRDSYLRLNNLIFSLSLNLCNVWSYRDI
jgi:hypothetical protein